MFWKTLFVDSACCTTFFLGLIIQDPASPAFQVMASAWFWPCWLMRRASPKTPKKPDWSRSECCSAIMYYHVLSCTIMYSLRLSRYDPEVFSHLPSGIFFLWSARLEDPRGAEVSGKSIKLWGGFSSHVFRTRRWDDQPAWKRNCWNKSSRRRIVFEYYCCSTLYICSSSGSMYDVDHCLVSLFELSWCFVVNSWLIIHVYIVMLMLYHVQ